MLCSAIKAAGVRLPVDQRVRQYVRQQVADGIFNVAEVQRHTEGWVKRSLFDGQSVPSKLNRRYFPHRRDYENLIYRARVDAMKSVVDQKNLQLKVSEWQLESDVKVYFRPYTDSNSNYTDDDDNVAVLGEVGSGLLFVHQTEWQQRLLRRYGSLCLLDATYRTTRYALPLFFICVRTNVDYIIVASFITQNESSGAIAEALDVLKSWTPDWNPSSFMVDMCEAELKALQSVFPGKLLLHCTTVF